MKNIKNVIEFKIRVDKDLKEELLAKLKLTNNQLINYKILRESIDARDKTNVQYNYLIEIETTKKIPLKYIKENKIVEPLKLKTLNLLYKPIIIGSGPAGLFSALLLARMNTNPIIIERGEEVDKRKEKVEKFFKNKILDLNSNVVFGEGGAGTFSDGKLQTNINSPYIRFILEEFVKHGANSDILTSNYPHIGTDILAIVIPNIRKEIENLGGKFYFNTTFLDFVENDDHIVVKCSNDLLFKTRHLILAIGHSAYDTFKMLRKNNVLLEPKNFAIGLRIEHLQQDINKAQYGEFKDYLKAANYKLACHLKDRSIFTFCMCPGGYVVASQNEPNTIVTNGMSNNKREGINANSALLCEVKVADYYNGDPLDGFKFIKDIEKKAFKISNDYRAPSNLVKEFMQNEVASEIRRIKPTYPHNIKFCNLDLVLPKFVIDSIREGLPYLDKKLKGFLDDDAILTAVETRSSCPVQIKRNNYHANIKYLYPIGEGSGYAGGITTSALDGIKCVMQIMEEEENEY